MCARRSIRRRWRRRRRESSNVAKWYFAPGREAELAKRTAAEQVAFDRGGGSRCISHRRENPYSLEAQAEQHAAWEAGWGQQDAAIA